MLYQSSNGYQSILMKKIRLKEEDLGTIWEDQPGPI